MHRLYILLTVMVVMVVASLFAVDQVRAQNRTGTTGTTTPIDESAISCQNARQVLVPDTFTGDSTTNTFTTTTNVFRVNYASSTAASGGNARIRILDQASQPVAGAEQTISADADTSVFFNLDPGTYRVEVDIDPASVEDVVTYRVSVDECRETTTAPTDNTVIVGGSNPAGAGGAADSTVIVGTPGTIDTTPTTGSTTVVPGGSREVITTPGGTTEVISPGVGSTTKDGVISKTIPETTVLPSTGGLSLPGPAVAVLALLISGAVIRLLSVVRR